MRPVLLALLAACTASPTDSGPTDTGTLFVFPETGLPNLEVLTVDPERSEVASGFIAAAVLTDDLSGLALYDGQGRIVWGVLAADHEIAASPVFGRDQQSILAFFSDRDRTVDGGVIRRFSLDSSDPLTETTATTGHHAFVELPTGELAWLSRNFPTVDGTKLLNDTVRVGTEGSTDGGAIRFDLLDHVPAHRPCAHFDPVHARYGETGLHDWSHTNSLVYDADHNELIAGVRHHDTVLGIDASTGDLHWTAGGQTPDLVPTDPWSHAHFSEASHDRVLLFDNGVHNTPETSRVVELTLDHSAGTATVLSQNPQPDAGFTEWLGDARTLPGGNRLIAYTELGLILELTPGGDTVWEAKLPDPNIGRIRFTPSLTGFPPG